MPSPPFSARFSVNSFPGLSANGSPTRPSGGTPGDGSSGGPWNCGRFRVIPTLSSAKIVVKMRQARREREAATAFEKVGASVEWSAPSEPVWLRKLLGDDFFIHVEAVKIGLYPTKMTNTDLDNLKELTQLHKLFLWDVNVTDNGLENIRGLSQLDELCFRDIKITDSGLENIKGLSQLHRLSLIGVNITDAGLEKLKGLRQLKMLYCDGTKVTAEGIKKLRHELPNCEIIAN